MTNRLFGVAAGVMAAAAFVANAAEERPTGLDALSVPEGFSIEIAATADLTSYPMFMTFDERGRMFVAESSGKDLSGKEMVQAPECLILLLEDTDSDGRFDSRKVFADTLSLPMGVLWHQGALYVASPPEFIRFTDTDNDGVADSREVLLSGWNIFNTASLHGPFAGPDGWLYLTHGRHGYDITTKEGTRLEGLASRIWRCRPDGTGLDRMAGGGFDNPVEIVFMDGGDSIGTMTYFTDPRNGQRDALMHWVEGGVYPKPHESTAEFVRTGDLMPVLTKFSRIAPSGLERYRGEAFGPEYKDNLFSAQFNPHRVQRHIVAREGATFTCQDEDFLVSSDPDFHPTDVIEDADGSLLVCDTGAWYVDACPISRVAKPEIRGGIYRIRRDGAPTVEDAWGDGIDWETVAPEGLAALLGDARPRVRDRAVEEVVRRGADAVPALEGILTASDAPRARENAVWALGRIVAPGSHPALILALGDDTPAVKMAAARMLGLAKDRGAAEALEGLLKDPDAGVRRQAATALGQIGAGGAGEALLAACVAPADRFEEHALVYAAIQVKAEEAALAALNRGEANVRKCALIALDQMGSEALNADLVLPFLESEEESLRNTGLWVASRHPEWSEVVLAFVDVRLAADIDAVQEAALRDVLLAYAQDAGMQALVARWLTREGLSEERALFLLDIVAEAALKDTPEPWVAGLKEQIVEGPAAVRWRALDVVRTRGVSALDDILMQLALDAGEDVGLRLAALSAVASRQEKLSDEALGFLFGLLPEEVDPTLRLEAARILADANLDAATLERLATDAIPAADALTFPTLLNAFRENRDESVGLALVEGLSHAKVNPGMAPGGLDVVFAGYPESVQTAAAPLKAQTESEAAARIERLKELEPMLGSGDVGRGRQVFFGTKANCYTCHAVGEEGGRLGPDLTTIGEVRSGHDLLEAVLFPNASFVPDYEPYRIKTWDDIYEGVVVKQDQESVLLGVSIDTQVRIPRSEIMEMTLGGVSIMPEGLDVALSQEELIDLMAFLQSLNGEVWLLPEQRD